MTAAKNLKIKCSAVAIRMPYQPMSKLNTNSHTKKMCMMAEVARTAKLAKVYLTESAHNVMVKP